MKIRKCLCALSLVLAAALGFGAGRYSAPASVEVMAVQTAQEDSIAAFRTEREQLRAMERAQLSEIIHSQDAEEEIVGMAQRRLIELGGEQEAETELEGMLRLRGYGESIVTVGQGGVNVLVKTELLTRQDSSLILDMVCRETGAGSGDVKIIPIK